VSVLLGLLAASTVASAAAPVRLTRCEATTLEGAGVGLALFSGSCNGSVTRLNVSAGSVLGRVGGLATTLQRTGQVYTGHIGGSKTSLSFLGASVVGPLRPRRGEVRRPSNYGERPSGERKGPVLGQAAHAAR
jgi:hypothetical protein